MIYRHRTQQIITVLMVFLVLSVFSVYASTAFHKILIGANRAPELYPFKECIKGIMTAEKHRLLFLCLEGLAFVASAALCISYSRNYISKLQKITPRIYTPVAAGQNQHGSATWMKEKEKLKAFDTMILNPKDKLFELLIKAGKRDRAVIKKHVIKDEEGKEKKEHSAVYNAIRAAFKKHVSPALKSCVNKIYSREKLDKTAVKLRRCIDRQLEEFMRIYLPGMYKRKKAKQLDAELSVFDDELFPEETPDEETKEQECTAIVKAGTRAITEFEKGMSSLKLTKGGIVIGMKKMLGGKELIFYVSDDAHVLCIGATRSGKSRVLVIQSICLLALAGESMVISDLKGELNQYTSEFLKRLGYNVVILDFKNPLKSDRYNLLQPVIDAIDEDNVPKAVECVWDLVGILVGEAKGEKIWTNGEASIIACAIMAVVYDNKEGERRKYQTLANVYFFIAEMCKTIGKKIPLAEYVKQLPDNHPAKPLVAISEIAPERTRGSFFTAALVTLRLFTSSYLNAMTCSSDYKPKNLGREKTALFFVLPDERTTYYSIASLLVLQHYIQLVNESDTRGGRLKKRVNVILDEFGNFAQIPSFDTLLTVGGGRGIRFNLFLQDFAQLEKKYEKETSQTIKGNCQVWTYLQTDTLDTLKEISEKLGRYTVSTYSLSSQSSKYQSASSTASVNLTGRELLTTDEVKAINCPYSLVTSRENPAIMYSPDLSKWHFNIMLGLGNEAHNIKARSYREEMRPERMSKQDAEKIELWSECWKHWQKVCEQNQEAQQVPPVQPFRRTINRRDEDYY